MKLGKLIIAGLCVCTFSSFSAAPVKISGDDCSTSINHTPNTEGVFNHSEDYDDKELYLAGYRLGVRGIDYSTLHDLYPNNIKQYDFFAGYLDGHDRYEYMQNQH